MYRILVVEDDEVIAGEIANGLNSWGFTVQCISNFNEVLTEFASFMPHLVLMDVMLPYFNGYYWCGEIRKVSKVPIIFLSSASDNMNIVMAMNMGGDDFMAKPFDMGVLQAKVQAMLRRSYDFQAQTSLLEYGGVILDLASASLQYQDKQLTLTRNEFKMLQILFSHKGEIVSREDIMKQLWDDDCFVDDNTLAVNMTRLRKKLEEMGLTELIQTRKGIGYYLNEIK